MPTGIHKKRGTRGRLTRDGDLPLPVRSFNPLRANDALRHSPAGEGDDDGMGRASFYTFF